jgi:hypothetical protein
MFHESIKVNEFLVKDNPGFRMRVQAWEVASPKGLYSLDFIQESKDSDGEIIGTQTYNFFMTADEISKLCEGLQNASKS